MKEDYMVYNYLLKHAKFRICTSATTGTQENTIDTFGLYLEEGNNGCVFNRIESGFDFSKSPIYAIMSYSMGKNYIDENLPKVGDMIMKLLTITFPAERGIIQTGSYKNAKRLFDMAPPEVKERMLLYRGSKEKTAAIEEHKKSKNTILVGPTLFEGIDLPGDLCRFIIVAKVPYPSLGSNLNRKKIELFPDWYQNLTSTVLIQGIGRGVRYNGDWCKTYIMDNCFRRLYRNTKDQYSEEMQKRIKFRG
jgi:Rad3-related DNA helicase